MEPLAGLACQSQRIVQHAQSRFGLSRFSIGVSQQRQQRRAPQRRPGRFVGGEAFSYLCDSLLVTTLLGQGPALQDGAPGQVQGIPPFVRKRDSSFGKLPGSMRLTPVLMELGRKGQPQGKCQRVGGTSGQLESFLAAHAGLIRKAQVPENPAQSATRMNRGIPRVTQKATVMRLVGTVQRQRLLLVGTGLADFAETEHSGAENTVCLGQLFGLLCFLAQA
ncbi:hypothetical protein D3C72_1452640 [compost metagenome]